MAEPSKFQFQMRDLLWAVSLIGAGLGLWLATRPSGWQSAAQVVVIVSTACFGAAIGCLFRKALAGAYTGATCGFLFLFVRAALMIGLR